MQYNSFEERINRKLANATMPPRMEVWDKISHDLEKPPHHNNKKWWLLGLCLLLCVASTCIFVLKQQKNTASLASSKTTKEVNQAEKNIQPTTPPTTKANTMPLVEQTKSIVPVQKTISTNSTVVPNEIGLTQNTHTTNKGILIESARNQIVMPKEVAKSIVLPVEKVALPSENMNEALAMKGEKSLEKPEISQNEVSSTITLSPPATNLPSMKSINKLVFKHHFLPQNTHSIVSSLIDIPTPNKKHKWTWNISAGNYSILYQSFTNNKSNLKYTRLQESLGVANIGVGDSTSNLAIYNDQSLSVASQSVMQVSDTSLLKITVSPTTQFATFSGEYRLSRRFGIETGLSFYYQKMNRILIPISDINSFGEAVASSKTTPYYGNNKSAIPFKFYIIEPKVLFNMHFGKGHSDVGIAAGMAYRALIGATDSNAALRIAQIASKDSQVYNPHNFALLGRLKYTYHINEKLGVFSALNSQILLNRMYSQGISYKSPTMLGLELGLSF